MPTTQTTRERLIDAAFELFAECGFDAATVEDVAERAGVGRTTFFRHFRSKEEVIFPDHAQVVGAIENRLASATADTALIAVSEAAGLVLAHYLGEGARAQARYRLTRSVPALRSREIANLLQYQRTFRTFLHDWMGQTPQAALRAEVMANAVVTAHNHVLRRWLRGETTTTTAAKREFHRAMGEVLDLFGGFFTRGNPSRSGSGDEATLLVLRTTRPLSDIQHALRDLTEPAAGQLHG